jgi:hypothetical protein
MRGANVGLFGKGKERTPDRHVSNALNNAGDGYYETEVVGEGKHRDHLVAVLKSHKRAKGWDDGRVAVSALLIPLGADGYGRFAVEIDGVRVGFVADEWVTLWGETYTRAAASISRPVAYECPAALCWSVSRGNPLKDESVPIGVRLDLSDEDAIRREMRNL